MSNPIALHISDAGYGWSLNLGKRVRWSSRKATTRMKPKIIPGADENCNRAITLMLWPLGHLDVWWEPRYRTFRDGPCGPCRVEARSHGVCEWCSCRPCDCEARQNDRLKKS